MEVKIVLGLSIVLQFVAAVLSFRLMRVTGRRWGWGAIAVAITLMAVRRSITWARVVTADVDVPPDLAAESVALLISILMVVGVGSIAPFFSTIRRSEAAIAESELRYRTLAERSPVGIFRTDAAGDCVYVNDRWCAIAGLTPAQAMGDGWLAGIHPDDRERVRREWHESTRASRPVRAEIRFRSREGVTTWVVSQAEVVIDDDGKVTGYVGNVTDITDRKHAEEALRESEAHLRDAQRVAHIGWWKWNIVTGALFWSDEIYRIFGMPKEAFGASYDAFMAAVYPDDRVKVESRVQAALTGQVDYEVDHRIVRPDGEVRHVLEKGEVRRDIEGQPSEMLGTVTDITESKRAEQKFRDLLESAPDAMVIVDLSGEIVLVNARAEQLFGYARQEMLGQPIELLVPDRFRAGHVVWRRGFLEDPAARQMGANLLLHGRRRNGLEFPSEVSLSPIETEGGLLVASTVRDISERRRAEEETERLASQLRQAQKMEAVGQLASGVAHDFNNLLTVISANASLLKNMLDDSENVSASLEMIGQAVEQAAGVTRSLLTFGRRLPADKVSVDLGAVVQATARMVERALPATIELVVETPKERTPWVKGDQTQLQQIVLNLVVNARDAMPDGGKLHITVSSDALDARAVPTIARLSVRDTGAGMPAEVRARIFDPFFTTKSRGQGTGLGLAVVDGIVREHGAKISVQSELGKGSTFVIDFPCVMSEASSHETVVEGEFLGNGEVILLAEDQRQLCEVLAALLRSMRYEVVVANDGDELLDLFREHRDRINLFVFDIDLPKRSGLDGLRAIRKTGNTVPAIIVTGSTSAVLDREDTGAILLRKPFEMPTLARLVHETLRTMSGASAV